jgi:hypothetical protein
MFCLFWASSLKKRKNMKSILKALDYCNRFFLLAGLFLGLSCYLIPQIMLPLIVKPLVAADELTGDYEFVVLLMGAPTTRPIKAASLINSGTAKYVIMSEVEPNALQEAHLIPTETLLAQEALRKNGVTEKQMQVIGLPARVSSTFEEAKAVRRYLETEILSGRLRAETKFLIVTSWYHTERAKWIFMQVLPEALQNFSMVAASEPKFSPDDWWLSEDGLIVVFEEFIKWGRYLMKYSNLQR